PLTVSGLSTFSGGTQSGSGTTIAQGGATFSSTGFILDGTRTLQLGGASTATGTSAQIQLNGSSAPGSGTLTIASGASFTDQTTRDRKSTRTNSSHVDTSDTATGNKKDNFTKRGSAATSAIST